MSPELTYYVPPDQEGHFESLIAHAKIPGVKLIGRQDSNRDNLGEFQTVLSELRERVRLIISLAVSDDPEMKGQFDTKYKTLFIKAHAATKKYRRNSPENINFEDSDQLPDLQNALFNIFLRPTTIDVDTIAKGHGYGNINWERIGSPLSPKDIHALIDRFDLDGQEHGNIGEMAESWSLSYSGMQQRIKGAIWRLGKTLEITEILEQRFNK